MPAGLTWQRSKLTFWIMNVWAGTLVAGLILKHKWEPGVIKTILTEGKFSGVLQNIKPIRNYLNIMFHE